MSLGLALLLAASFALAQTADRRGALRTAFAEAAAGRLDAAQALRFRRDPLYPWLQATALRKNIRTVTASEVKAVLDAAGNQPAGDWLRAAWLGETARREDWPAFLAAWRDSEDAGLRCAHLQARLATGAVDAAWSADARRVWLTGSSLPDRCDAAFERLASLGQLDDGLRWQRIDLAIAEGEAGLVRYIAKGMASPARALAESYAAYLAAPGATLPTDWPNDARSREVATVALSRLARRDPDRAEQLLGQAPGAKLDAGQRGRVAYQVALWTVASYLPGSAARLNAVPATAYDERLHEWRVREALSRQDDAAALAAIGKMGEAQRSDARWLYFEARLRERLGQAQAAKALYGKAAQDPGFHGWLAADRLQRPYTLCAVEPAADAAIVGRVGSHAGLARALDLFAIDQVPAATREWSAAVDAMSHDERRLAVRRAIAEGWFDRSVFGMGKVPEDARHYSLRFPLQHEAEIRAQARVNALDPAWVAGQTRAESAFMPRARSGADARGLMQVLPGTGELVARRLGLPWRGGESLYEPTTNIVLGTAYMRQMLDRFGGRPYLAIAAYNAGPSPIERWRAERGQLDPDFFIETMPYKETREYVARVLAFSVVYDWRLNGNAAPLGERMLGRLVEAADQRRPFTCPTGIARQP